MISKKNAFAPSCACVDAESPDVVSETKIANKKRPINGAAADDRASEEDGCYMDSLTVLPPAPYSPVYCSTMSISSQECLNNPACPDDDGSLEHVKRHILPKLRDRSHQHVARLIFGKIEWTGAEGVAAL